MIRPDPDSRYLAWRSDAHISAFELVYGFRRHLSPMGDRAVHAVASVHRAGLAGVIATAAAMEDGSALAHSGDSAWSYPPACCHGDAITGECSRIPSSTVTPRSNGYDIILRPGDHRKVTLRNQYFVPTMTSSACRAARRPHDLLRHFRQQVEDGRQQRRDHLGFIPQDSAEPFRAAIEAKTPIPDPKRPSVKYLGWFCELGHPDDKPECRTKRRSID